MSTIKKVVVTLLIILVLTACGSNADEQSAPNTDPGVVEDSQGEQTTEGSRQSFRENLVNSELPPVTQLAVGTILLDNTDIAVDNEQAQILIPYWKLYLNLLESDATAREELDAMISEIQGVMTTQQLSYITDLGLVQEDLMTLMSDLGIEEGFRTDGEDGEGFTRPEGMDGLRPGGGEGRGPGGGEGLDPELMATMEARREEMGGAGLMGATRMQIPVIEALIEMLEGMFE